MIDEAFDFLQVDQTKIPVKTTPSVTETVMPKQNTSTPPPAPTPTPGLPTLVNGDFEDGPGGWGEFSSNNYALVTDDTSAGLPAGFTARSVNQGEVAHGYVPQPAMLHHHLPERCCRQICDCIPTWRVWFRDTLRNPCFVVKPNRIPSSLKKEFRERRRSYTCSDLVKLLWNDSAGRLFKVICCHVTSPFERVTGARHPPAASFTHYHILPLVA